MATNTPRAKFARLSRLGEVPAIVGGIALLVIGRRLGGATGRAVGAMGATISLTAGGRVFNRFALSRLKAPESAEPIPS